MSQIFLFGYRLFDYGCFRNISFSVSFSKLDGVASQMCNIMENCVVGRFNLMHHSGIFIDRHLTIEISLWMV